MRTHLILSDDLIKRLDNLVGKRKRSRFIEEAIRDKMRKEELLMALKETKGILSAEKHPEWETKADSAEWVRKSRQVDKERMRKLSYPT